MTHTRTHTTQTGALVVLVIVFGAIFFLIVAAFMGFVITQSTIQERAVTKEQALAIAEAGLNHYKWFLAHNPNDVTFGTGAPGPYELPYYDPESDLVGTSSLAIASNSYCGVVSSIEITSTGYTADDPSVTRVAYGRYARPTVAEYSYIINSNVWAGSDRTIIGPYHSNGAIRMDGTNNSTVSSGLSDWTCDGSINCDTGGVSVGDTIPAVFGSGPNSALWNTGVPPIGFAGITVDLNNIETAACSVGSNGICLPESGDWGYRIDFQNDDTIDVYVVNSVLSYDAAETGAAPFTEQNVINTDNYLASYVIDDSCPLIFVEDKVWLEGEVSTLVSIAAADNDLGDPDHSIILNDNITYTTASSGLLAVAEEDVLVGLDVPDQMELNGIFIAQNGHFGRNFYSPNEWRRWWWQDSGGNWFWQWMFSPNWVRNLAQRDELTINGTIVSNGRVGTKWGSFVSGFDTRYNSYDRFLVDNPPPLAPHTSDDYKFVEWREVE